MNININKNITTMNSIHEIFCSLTDWKSKYYKKIIPGIINKY